MVVGGVGKLLGLASCSDFCPPTVSGPDTDILGSKRAGPCRPQRYQGLIPLLGLAHTPTIWTDNINPSIAKQRLTHPVDEPTALSQLIVLNVEYGVLLCVTNSCRIAVSLASIVEHLRSIHDTTNATWKQVQEYIKRFPT
jgi:hypothetical protein